jgi:hypothetical protein
VYTGEYADVRLAVPNNFREVSFVLVFGYISLLCRIVSF